MMNIPEGWMKIQPSCMMNQINCQHIVHIRKTGKMTKKEARNLASKNMFQMDGERKLTKMKS